MRLRSAVALARFLRATPVRAVWYELFDPKTQRWSRQHLLLATETELAATEIIVIYARRWGIESLLHSLKRWWGANNLWQQSRRALELWMQLRSTAYALMHMLALQLPDAFPLVDIAPWRLHRPTITAGLFSTWLRYHFFGLHVLAGFDPKFAQFTFPATPMNPAVRPAPS